MSKNCCRVFLAFFIGQVAQLVFATVAKVSYMSKPILFCSAAGFILLVAVFAGVKLAMTEKPTEKSYLDYARERTTE